MAVFNPDVKDTQDPNYLNWSKPTSAIEADKSTGMLLSGAGQDFSNAVNLADESIKSKIQKDLYSQIDPIRDQFTQNVAALKPEATTPAAQPATNPGVNGVPATPQWAANTWGYTPKAADPASQPMSLLTNSDPDSVPSGISSGLDRAQTLQSALDGKHISETPYIAQLNAVAKQMRTDYPGYRPYIDQQLSSITGFDPANKLVSSVIQDAQNAAKNSLSEQEKTMNYIREHSDLASARQAAVLYPQGKMSSSDVIQTIGTELGNKTQLQVRALQREDIKGNQDMLKQQAGKDFGSYIDNDVNNQISTFTMGSGMTPARLQQIAEDRAAGIHNEFDDKDMTQYGILLQTQRQHLSNQYMAQAQQKDPKTGRSLMDDMGGDAQAVRTLIDGRLRFFDELSKSYSDKDPSAANIHAQVSKALLEDTKYGVLNGRDATQNKWFAGLATVNTLMPQLAPDLYKAANIDGVPDKIKGAVLYNDMDIIGQPSWREKGQPTSVNNVIGSSINNGVTSPSVYEHYINLSHRLTDPGLAAPLKRNIAASFFSAPDSLELLSKFNKDYTDAQGNKIPGKYAVFTQLTQPDITKTMVGLRNQYPQQWNDYVNWAQESFGNQLFRKEINDLGFLTTNPGYHVAWNSDTNQFILRDQNMNRVDDRSTAYSQRYVYQSLSNLNMGLRNLGHIAEAQGSDVGSYLLGRLQQSGVRIDKGIDGIPEKIMAAVLNARKDKKNLSNEDITGISVENK